MIFFFVCVSIDVCVSKFVYTHDILSCTIMFFVCVSIDVCMYIWTHIENIFFFAFVSIDVCMYI